MSFTKARFLVVFTVVTLTGCKNPFGGPDLCPAVVNPAIVVEIRDAGTGAPLANGARGAVHDGAYVDSLTPYESTGPGIETLVSLSGAHGRSGTYAIEVNRAGYRPWTAAGVRVVEESCGVRTRRVSASLEPSL